METNRERRGLKLAKALTVAGAVGAMSAALVGCGSDKSSSDSSGSAGSSPSAELNVVGFAVIESVYDELEASFKKTDAGKNVTFKGSYGASGDQSKAVAAGAKADIVEFSVTPDLTRLVDAGLVGEDWNAGANKGIVSKSVVVLAVRKGNPKKIAGWDDIVKPGVKIVTADPTRSGAAKWNLLGAYSHGLGAANDAKAGEAFLKSFVGNVATWAESGRKATEAFTAGTGDVLITYENEAILAKQAGEEIDYVVPSDSFLIENPGAVTKAAPPAAKTFLDFVISDEGQKIFAGKGFRPLNDSVDPGTVEGANDPSKPFPAIDRLGTIADLGGWKAVNTLLFNDGALVPTLQAAAK